MERMERLREKARQLTDKPGVYLMKDNTGEVIYVGKAKRLKNRVSSYFRKNSSHNEKVRKMVSNVQDFDFIVTDSEFEALVLECSLIKQYDPKYNILLKDDKGYHYIKISSDPYPKITSEKQHTGTGSFIGPYTSSMAVKQTVNEVNKVFRLPTCTRKFNFQRNTRPCLNYYIKQCAGICLGKISEEEYQETIRQAVDYIKGGSTQSIEKLTKEMEQASEQLDFERAIRIRDRIQAIQKISEDQKVILGNQKQIDVIAMAQNGTTVCFSLLKFRHGKMVDKSDFIFDDVYDPIEVRNDFISRYYTSHPDFPKIVLTDEVNIAQSLLTDYLTKLAGYKVEIQVPQRGENRKLVQMAMSNAAEQLSYKVKRSGRAIAALDELSRLLGLSTTPEIIEAYDISNLGDSGIVGGMVVFENGQPKKSDYRKFAIHSTNTRDDYGSMREMLERRFSRYQTEQGESSFGRLPDLILLDGGKGHVAAVKEIFQKYGIDVPYFGMVKDDKHRTRAIAKEGGEISIAAYKSAFHLLTRIQDEVHRYTISYQRNVRKKTMLEMEITRVKGIGEKKALAILRHFKTKTALYNATVEELCQVAKIKPETARELQLFLEQLK